MPDRSPLPGSISLGKFELTLVCDGTYLLDGGAFFGVVPKTLWSRKKAADGQNQLRAGLNCLLVKGPRATILIETGIGAKLDRKACELHGVERPQGLPAELAAAGAEAASIQFVVNTHLHFDHCGGNTLWAPGPRPGARDVAPGVLPVFPNAQYLAQRGEWEHAHLRLDRDRVSYLDENYDPLVQTGQMKLLDGDCELVPGVRLAVVPGHTRHMQIVLVQSGGRTCAFFSDLIPSTAHLTPTWVMAYDLFPLESIENKKKLLSQAAAERWLCVFVHDAESPWGYVRAAERGKYEFEPLS